MTLDGLKPLAGRVTNPAVRLCVTLGVSPNQVSALSFVVAAAAGVSFYAAEPTGYVVGALLVSISGLLDVVDGELARETGGGDDRGDFLDHVLDRYSDMAIIVGIVAGLDSWILGVLALTGVFLTSYMGTQAQAVGAGREYGGLVGRADRLVLISVAAVAHAFVPTLVYLSPLDWVLVILAAVGNLTALQRFVYTWGELSG